MWCCGLVLVGLLAGAQAVQAGDKTKPAGDEPTVVVRVKSLDTVLQNVKLLTALIGREQAAGDIEGLIRAKVGAKGLQGVDPARPVGVYVRFGEELGDVNGAVLVPVADDKAFIALLTNLGLKPTEGKGGIWTLQAKSNIELYLRFAKGYAYVTAVSTDNLADKQLLDPAKVLAGAQDSLLSVVVRLDQVPDAAKLLVKAQLEQTLQDLQDQAPAAETPAQKAFRNAVAHQVIKSVGAALEGGQRARLDVNVTDGKKDLSIKVALTPQPGSELARSLQEVGKSRSPFAGLLTKGAAFRGSVDAVVPDAVRQTFAKAVEEAGQKGVADISNPEKRKQAQALVDALLPTVREGRLDAFFGMAGPVNDRYTLLTAVHVKDGDKLGQVVHDLVAEEIKNLPPEQRKKIQLDMDAAGPVKIHKFELPRDVKSGKVLDDLPGDPNLYVAFRKDAVFLAIGQESLPALKEAVGTEKAAPGPAFLFDFNVARMAPVLAQTPEQKDLARKLFGGGKDGNIRLAVEGGEALTLRLSIGLDVLEFFAKMREGKGKE
jgi:hypothetical protein